MSLTTIAVVSFSLAKVVMRLSGVGDWADAADDVGPVLTKLQRLRQRKLTKSLADEFASDLHDLSPTQLADNDRSAALESVDQFLNELGVSVNVQAAALGEDIWEWVLSNGGRRHQKGLGGDAGEYFLQVLHRCVDEIRRRAPAPGAPTAAEVQLLAGGMALSRQMKELHQQSEDALRRLLRDEPHRREALERITAASAAYHRELALPKGQYVVRTAESALLSSIEHGGRPWPRIIVGDAGAGKSTLMWSLKDDLERMGLDPLLVSTAWLIAQPQRIDTLIGAIELLRDHATPVLLLDTVDLMLHQEPQRQTFLALMEQLWVAEIPALYTTRPDERRLIHHPDLRDVELATYDDAELRLAADALVGRYCPDAVSDVVREGILDSVARGLPAADVCRSPLMLRMLFESAAPGAPEFADLDVTGLYDAYWERRVVRDARSYGAVWLPPNQHDDLTLVAEAAAAALLVMGLPQERERKATTVIECLEPRLGSAVMNESLALLRDRGVLEINEAVLGFFHQTMLEYSFARWWLASRDPDVLAKLVERTSAGLGDLFVGAALEQVLILAAREGPGAAVQTACRALIDNASGSIQAIGLAAWAHHAAALRPATKALATCDPAALARAARLLPGIGGKRVGEVVSQLILIWEASDAETSRIAVVRALARVALRDADAVIDAVDHLYPAGAVPRPEHTPSPRNEDEVERAARSISAPLPDLLLAAFVDLFERIPARHAPVIRRLCVSLLQRGDNSRRTLLMYLAENWQEMGSAALLAEVLHALGFPDHLATGLLEPCGHLVAEEWARRTHERGEVLDIDQALASIAPVYGRSIAAFAIGALAHRIDGDRLRAAIVHLVSERGHFAAESRTSLSDLLQSHRPAVHCFSDLTTAACAELKAGELSDLGRRVLSFLASSQLPNELYFRAFPQVDVDDWTTHTELAPILVRAAARGVEPARSALERLAADPLSVSPELARALYTSPAATSIHDDRVLEQTVWLAIASGQETALERLLSDPSLTDKRWRLVYERLMARADDGESAHLELGEQLKSHVLRHRAELIEWNDTIASLESADEALRAAILGKLWKRRENGSIDEARIAYLRRIVNVNPEAAVPVDRTSGEVPVSVLKSAAQTLHFICALRHPASSDDWPTVHTLTLYPPLNLEPLVLGRSLAATCKYLENIGAQYHAEMPAMLVDLLDGMAQSPFIGIEPRLWRRDLLNAVNRAVEIGGEDVVHKLLGAAEQVEASLARTLIEGLAERWFVDARESLVELSRHAISQDLREICQELVRQHDRSAGTRSFPGLVPPLADRLSNLV